MVFSHAGHITMEISLDNAGLSSSITGMRTTPESVTTRKTTVWTPLPKVEGQEVFIWPVSGWVTTYKLYTPLLNFYDGRIGINKYPFVTSVPLNLKL